MSNNWRIANKEEAEEYLKIMNEKGWQVDAYSNIEEGVLKIGLRLIVNDKAEESKAKKKND